VLFVRLAGGQASGVDDHVSLFPRSARRCR
jgi:hypothetical protein